MKITIEQICRWLEKSNKDCPSGCWEWTGHLNASGYGVFSVNGKSMMAHRFAWWYKTNNPPPSDLCVCHKCDNPKCVNPDHLFLGTNRDNILDSIKKGRFITDARMGESHPKAKLTYEIVSEIRKLPSLKGHRNRLAAALGVDPTTIQRAYNGRFWSARKALEGK